MLAPVSTSALMGIPKIEMLTVFLSTGMIRLTFLSDETAFGLAGWCF